MKPNYCAPDPKCSTLIEAAQARLKSYQDQIRAFRELGMDDMVELTRGAINSDKSWIKRREQWHFRVCLDQGTR